MLPRWIRKGTWPEKAGTLRSFDRYVLSVPCSQNAVDAIPGWNTSFPPHYGLKAGCLDAHNDRRIIWAMECFGSLAGRHVLELGPVEGGHTCMLEAGGARVDAVEPNHLAFMRCLITKEIAGLTRSKFWLGDFMQALENWNESYDLIVACDVLCNLRKPLDFIELAANRTDALYLTTPTVADGAMLSTGPGHCELAPTFERRLFHGAAVRMYQRTRAHDEASIAHGNGGTETQRWLHCDDLMEALSAVGFRDIRTSRGEADHRCAPHLSIFARRSI